jgi:hypothetical protein
MSLPNRLAPDVNWTRHPYPHHLLEVGHDCKESLSKKHLYLLYKVYNNESTGEIPQNYD